MVILCTVLHSKQFKDLHEKPLHSAVTVRQASDTHIEKPSHFKTQIAAEPEVVPIYHPKKFLELSFQIYILSFVHIVTKILSSKLLAYKGSGGVTSQKFPLELFDKKT